MKVHENVLLSEILWYKIGGTARYVLDVGSIDDVKEAIAFVQKKKIQNVFFLGLGSNLVFSDDYFDGAIIHFIKSSGMQPQLKEPLVIEAFAGLLLDDIIIFGFSHGLIGLEWAGGLPGTVGAAVRGNVGAFGGEIKDVVRDVAVIDLRGENMSVQNLNREELQFSYRESLIKHQKNLLVVAARFQLQKAESEDQLIKAKETYVSNKAYREKNHPLEYPNCGSVFKNIHNKEQVQQVLAIWPDIQDQVTEKWHGKVSMGYIIKRLGFSGLRIGGAEVSEKHSNFIINRGGATAADVLTIITKIQEKCKEVFGFTPEVEPEII